MMGRYRVGGLAMALLVGTLGFAAEVRAESALITAVKNGADAKTVRPLLNRKAAINETEADGTTALHWAVYRNDLATAELLLKAGARVKVANRYGMTPLYLAATNGNGPMVERLLAAGADPNTLGPDGNSTALMTAAKTGIVASVKALLAHGASVDAAEPRRGQTALMFAAARNNHEVVKLLIESGADVHARSKLRPAPLPYGNADFRGDGVNFITNPIIPGGWSSLLFAVRGGHLETTRELLKAGADVNEALPSGMTALVLAVANANYELAAFLLDQGANPNANKPGWTALHQLAITRNPGAGLCDPNVVGTGSMSGVELAGRLIAHGADVNARMTEEPDDRNCNGLNRYGATPFLVAAKAHDLPLMRTLVAAGADPLLPTENGDTPLMVAAGVGVVPGEDAGTPEGSTEAVKYILSLGGDPIAADMYGWTPLHGAAVWGTNDVVKILVDRGAKLDARTKLGPWPAGWTPWRIAEGVYYGGAAVTNHFDTADLLATLMKERGLPVEDTVPIVGAVETRVRKDLIVASGLASALPIAGSTTDEAKPENGKPEDEKSDVKRQSPSPR